MSTYPKPSKYRIALLGDVMLGRLVDQIFPTHVNEQEEYQHAKALLQMRGGGLKIGQIPYSYVWGNVLPDLLACNVRIINLETSVTTHATRWPDKAFNYRMHPDNLQCLREAKINYCSLANNHTLDFEEQGMKDTMEALERYGIPFAGVGHSSREAMKPAIFTVCEGMKFACFSFSDHYDFWAAGPRKAGINYIDADNYTPEDVKKIKENIEQVKSHHNPDIVVFSIHWGPNYAWKPDPQKVKLAHELIDHCGVDILHGHSSHHIQGIEFYKGKPIIYGCGDFIDDYAVTPQFRNDLGFAYMLNWNVEKRRAESMDLIPTKISVFQATKTMPSDDLQWLQSKMKKLCGDFGTSVTVCPDASLHLPCP